LTGCSGKSKTQCTPVVETETRYEKQAVPGELLALPDLPDLPERNQTKMQSDVQPYYIEVGSQLRKCRDNVEAIRGLVKTTEGIEP
jgi:hypothetical protein